jgi:hypothetical protein
MARIASNVRRITLGVVHAVKSYVATLGVDDGPPIIL